MRISAGTDHRARRFGKLNIFGGTTIDETTLVDIDDHPIVGRIGGDGVSAGAVGAR